MSQDFYGGGFTNSPFSGSVDGSPSSGVRKDSTHSLTPVFISQLHKATQAHADAEWKLDDAPIGQVTLVGHVVEIRKQSSHVTYKFEDQLGTIDARTWSEGSEEDEDKWGVQVHGYARVVGTLKSFGGRRYINATHLRPCHDSNEFYLHVFEAITVHMTHKFGPALNNSQGAVKTGGASKDAGNASGISDYAAGTTPAGASNDQWAKLPVLQQQILRAIVDEPEHDVSGAYVGNIAIKVGGKADAISEALDQLMDGGYIYTTSDDSHFAVSS